MPSIVMLSRRCSRSERIGGGVLFFATWPTPTLTDFGINGDGFLSPTAPAVRLRATAPPLEAFPPPFPCVITTTSSRRVHGNSDESESSWTGRALRSARGSGSAEYSSPSRKTSVRAVDARARRYAAIRLSGLLEYKSLDTRRAVMIEACCTSFDPEDAPDDSEPFVLIGLFWPLMGMCGEGR
jgi:hypothetical protein